MTDTGSTNDSSASSGSPASPPGSPCCCCPLHGGRKATTWRMDLLCWASVAVVTCMWAMTGKLDHVRGEIILAFFASAILPGSVLTSLGTTAIDRLVPARGGK